MTNSVIPFNRGTRGDVQAMQPMPDWVQELAYQLWAFVHSQNGSKVARALNAGDYTDDMGLVPEHEVEDGILPAIEITPQAVNKWARTHGWEERRVREVREYAPALHQKVASNIAMSSIEAEQFVSDVISGRITEREGLTAKMIDIRLKAAMTQLDRAGHTAYSRPREGEKPTAPRVDHARSIAGLSAEEKRRMALGEDA